MDIPWNDIASPLYFGAFWTLFGGLLICVRHLRPWQSVTTTLVAWIVSAGLAAGATAWTTGDLNGILVPLASSAALTLVAAFFSRRLTPFGFGVTVHRLYVPAMVLQVFHDCVERSGGSTLYWTAFAVFAAVTVAGSVINIYFPRSPIAEFVRRYPRREQAAAHIQATRGSVSRKVSIHIPCYAEPPELVKATLDAVSRLRYPNFEVLVIDNNTKDPNLWKPLERHCQQLGERFRFFHVDPIKGAKAGALNFAITQTAADAEVIAVIDADYIAEPDFLEKFMPLFDDPKTGFVQTTHDYRDWRDNRLLAAAYYEYVLNHKLTFPSFSEHDASFTVGTMCLLRREALVKAGGWAEWCLTEDSEIAVRIHAQGYSGHTFKDTAGRGLIPDTMEGMKKQQFRWTAGPVQQLLRHWKLYLGFRGHPLGRLTLSQRVLEFIHVSERVGSVTRLLGCIPAFAFGLYAILQGLVVPVAVPLLALGASMALAHTLENWTAVRRCGGTRLRDYLGWTLANSALQWTFISGFLAPFLGLRLTWHRTDKFEQTFSLGRALQASRTETLLALLHLAAAAIFLRYGHFAPVDYLAVAGVFFAVQGLRFLCTLIMALVAEFELYRAAPTPTPAVALGSMAGR